MKMTRGMVDNLTHKKCKLFDREATMGANICKQGRPGQVSLPLSDFCICIFVHVCSVYSGAGCDYAKYQILYLVNSKSIYFLCRGEEGVSVYLSSFCFICLPFYDWGIKQNSQYDAEMTPAKNCINVQIQIQNSNNTNIN